MNCFIQETTASVLFVIMGCSSVFSQTPSWWQNHQVISLTSASDDYSLINQGQVKRLAHAAYLAMEARLPGGAGLDLDLLIDSWSAPDESTDDYVVVNTGQLKEVFRRFQERLNEVNDTSGFPWSTMTADDDDFRPANLGQAKMLFSFPLPDPIPSIPPNPVSSPLQVWHGSLGGVGVPDPMAASAAEDLPLGTPRWGPYFGIVPDDIKTTLPLTLPPYDISQTAVPELKVGKKYCILRSYANTYTRSAGYWGGETHLDPVEGTSSSPFPMQFGPDFYFNAFYWDAQKTGEIIGTSSFDEWGDGNHASRIEKTEFTMTMTRPVINPRTGMTCPFALRFVALSRNGLAIGATPSPVIFSFPSVSAPLPGAPFSLLSSTASFVLPPPSGHGYWDLTHIPLDDSMHLSLSDGAGPRFRKIGWNGVPMPDEAPQPDAQDALPPSESYVDAYTRRLHHSVYDAYSSAGGLPLQVRRQLSPESWSVRFGYEPYERTDLAFGVGWRSNLTPCITFESASSNRQKLFYSRAEVTDENGETHVFMQTPEKPGMWIMSYDGRTPAKARNVHLVQDPFVPRTFRLIKKHGTVCVYHMISPLPGSPFGAWSTSRAHDRNKSKQTKLRGFARLLEVVDPLNNRLQYAYAPVGLSFIPTAIWDPARPAQRMTIMQEGDKVRAVRLPTGQVIHYDYTVATAPGAQETSGYPEMHLLSSVKQGTSASPPPVGTPGISYSYDIAVERDPTPHNTDALETEHVHVELAGITDALGRQYQFSHRHLAGAHAGEPSFDWGWSCHRNSVDMNGQPASQLRVEVGRPRLLTRITGPDGSMVDFSGDTGGTLLENATLQNARASTRVQGAGGQYEYVFANPHVSIPSYDTVNDHGQPVTIPLPEARALTFLEMNLYSGEFDSPTRLHEVFQFQPNAGMALRRQVNSNNRETRFEYENPVPSDSMNNVRSEFYDDPTKKINALNQSTTYEYQSSTRKPTEVVDEFGTRHVYVYDSANGNRLQREEVYDPRNPAGYTYGKLLYKKSFEYDAVFRSFVKKETVHAAATQVDAGELPPMGDMVTEFEPDANGRVAREIHHARLDNPATPGVDEAQKLTTTYEYNAIGQKTKVTDPRGKVTKFEYDPVTLRLSHIRHPTDQAEVFTTTSFEYDDCGNLTKETDEAGLVTWYEYDAYNRQTRKITDLDGNGLKSPRCTGWSLNAGAQPPSYNGDLVLETSYNTFNLPVDVTDERGVTTHHEYDSLGRLLRSTVNSTGPPEERVVARYADDDPLTADFIGGTAFDNSSYKPLRVYDPREFKTEIAYDALGRPWRKTLTDTSHTPAQSVVTEILYDAAGNPYVQTNAAGEKIVTYYDGLRRPTVVKKLAHDGGGDAGLAVPEVMQRFGYLPSGHAWKIVDAVGNRTLMEFDNLGREVKRTVSRVWDGTLTSTGARQYKAQVTQKAYDAAGNVVQAMDPLGRIADMTYDARKRLRTVEAPPVIDDADGEWKRPKTETVYDQAGRPHRMIDPLNKVSETLYDAAGRPSVSILPPVLVGNETTPRSVFVLTAYDPSGQPVAVQDPRGHRTYNSYDAHGRLKRTTRYLQGAEPTSGVGFDQEIWAPSGQGYEVASTQFGYDSAGNRTRVIDQRGNETTFHYDAQGRLMKEQLPLEQGAPSRREFRHEYDAARKLAQIDGMNRRTEFRYDAHGQVRRAIYVDPLVPEAPTRSFSYDKAGRITSVAESADALASISQVYSVNGWVEQETSAGRAHHYSYDLAGNLNRVRYSTDRVIETVFDYNNRPTDIIEGGRVTSLGYDLAGRMVRKTSANGIIERNQFDAQGRLKRRIVYASEAPAAVSILADFEWRHDEAGNVTRFTETWPGTLGITGRSQVTVMSYDRFNRLATETVAVGAALVRNVTHHYDLADNRVGETSLEPNGDVMERTFEPGASNQLLSMTRVRTVNGVAQPEPVVSYSYDDNGNRSTRSVAGQATPTLYAWDRLNRLAKVTLPTGAEHSYLYDHRSRRVQMQERSAAAAPAVSTLCTYSAGLSIAEYRGLGGAAPGGAPVVEMIRGSGLGGGIGGMLYSLRGGAAKFALSNGRGDVVAQTDEGKALTWAASYEAFGTRIAEAGENADRQRANTKEEDPTGLLYEGHRYRDLETGVWLSRDPAGFVDGPNLYAYVRQNPWTAFDPKGLATMMSMSGDDEDEEDEKHWKVNSTLTMDQERGETSAGTILGVGGSGSGGSSLELLDGFAQSEMDRSTQKSGGHPPERGAYDDMVSSQEIAQKRADLDRADNPEKYALEEALTNLAMDLPLLVLPGGPFTRGTLAEMGVLRASSRSLASRSLLQVEKSAAKTGVPANSTVGRILGKLDQYPQVIDPRTGTHIPLPSDVGSIVPKAQRVSWGATERGEFISEWYRRGYETPRGGWEHYDIHHIKPREFGGTNDFWNLAPVERQTHQNLFNTFWREFTGL